MIRVTCPRTCFGSIEKMFSDWDAALAWVRVCIANDVYCEIETLP